MKSSDNNTFVKITNMDIYKKIEEFEKSTLEKFDNVTQRQDRTNGKVKLSMWVATTAISIGLITIGFLLEHMIKS